MNQLIRRCMFSLCVLWTGAALAQVPANSADKTTSPIVVDEAQLLVKYGEYDEIELTLDANTNNKPVKWSVTAGSLPEGLTLEDSNTKTAFLYGTSMFTDQWCFLLSAQVENNIYNRELCVSSDDNDEMIYPKFKTKSLLKYAIKKQLYEAKIETDSDVPLVYTELISSTIPADAGVKVEISDDYETIRLRGRFQTAGLHLLALRLVDQDGYENFQQFRVNIFDEEPQNQCPPGYYYDETLGYCVQDRADACPSDTYYDPDRNICVQYPQAPPSVYCGIDSYYDHFLSRCVRIGYPRCPLNSYFDSYYNQCVRYSYSCPSGFNYNWSSRRCEYIYRRTCPSGFDYDYARDTCVRQHRYCSSGQSWNPRTDRCEWNSNYRSCRSGEYYSPQTRRCEPSRVQCRPHEYDNGNRCLPRLPDNRRCGTGETYSPSLGRCIPHRQPPRVDPPRRPLPPRVNPPDRRPPPHGRPPRVEPPPHRPPPSRPPRVDPPPRQDPPSRPPRQDPPKPPRQDPPTKPPRQDPPTKPPRVDPPPRQDPPSRPPRTDPPKDRKSTRLNSSHP